MLRRRWKGAPQWVLYQVAWWCCVLAPEPWGALSMALFVAVHLGASRGRRAAEWTVIGAATGLGLVVDGVLVHTGLVTYAGAQRLLGVPVWMLALWAGFGATLRNSQRFLVSSPVRGVVVGALIGPLAYTGGEGLGRMVVSGVSGTLSIGVTWAAAMGILAWLVGWSSRSALPDDKQTTESAEQRPL